MGILFDLEGTLVKSGYENNTQLVQELHDETKEKLIQFGIPKDTLKDLKSVYMRNAAFKWIRNNSISKLDELKQYVNSFLSPFDLESAFNSSLYENTIDVLSYLKSKKHELGIVTNTSQKAVSVIFQKCELEHFFEFVITRDDVYEIKPDPIMILKGNSRFRVKSTHFIGDSKIDVLAAHNAGLKSILIKRDNTNPEYKVDIIIRSLSELKSLF